MTRPQISVRQVTPKLEGDFTALWFAAHLDARATSGAHAADPGLVAAALARDDVRAYVAVVEDHPVGYIVLTKGPLSFLLDGPCVSIDQIFVLPDSRRGGVARALLTAAASYADCLGADQIASAVPAQGRDANRFFARLGFSSDVIRRVTTTSGLHRKLAAGEEPLPPLDRLLQRRRSLRARATHSTEVLHR